MNDPFFEKAVVLLWHLDDDGAAGLVLNRPIPHDLSEVVEGAVDYPGTTVVWGGPVERTRGTVVTPAPLPEDDGWNLRPGLSVGASQTALDHLFAERAPLILCLGYAGWSVGQLDHELATGSWLYADATDDLIFDAPRDELYDRALASLGLTSATVLMNHPAEA